MMTHFDSTMRL